MAGGLNITEIAEIAFVEPDVVEEFIRKAALQPIDGTTDLYPAVMAIIIIEEKRREMIAERRSEPR